MGFFYKVLSFCNQVLHKHDALQYNSGRKTNPTVIKPINWVRTYKPKSVMINVGSQVRRYWPATREQIAMGPSFNKTCPIFTYNIKISTYLCSNNLDTISPSNRIGTFQSKYDFLRQLFSKNSCSIYFIF